MKNFGQSLLDKAKASLAPKNKWLFHYKDLIQSIDKGRPSKKSIKHGKVHVDEDGLQFINDSKPSDNFTIEDYDSIHAVICKKNGSNYDVNFKGRKTQVLEVDGKDSLDPMELP